MKKKILLMFILFLFSIICFSPSNVYARNIDNAPYTTKIIGLDGNLVNSSIAYDGVFVIAPGFEKPTDLVIDSENNIYITDELNKLVYKYNIDNNTIISFGEGILEGPTGLCLDQEGNIYVADYSAKNIKEFNKELQLIKTFERPTEALFGSDQLFRPIKVSVDLGGNLYVISEGNANGIIRINPLGEFSGYFGANKVDVTFELLMKRAFLSEEDRETYASLKPRPTTNIYVDDRNITYSVIEGETGFSLKKYNVNGNNILSGAPFFSSTYQDITVDSNGFIYTVDKSDVGVISVLDSDGSLLFKFGDTKTNSISMGQFDKAVGIAVDSNDNIWVLDEAGKTLQAFKKTEFTNLVFLAKDYYDEGNYVKAQETYLEIIKQNSSFVNAYIGLGEIAMRNQDYHEALNYFSIANDKVGYSEAYWEIRDDFVGRNLLGISVIIILLIAARFFHLWGKLFAVLPKGLKAFGKKVNKKKITTELKCLFKVLRHPYDTFFDIKFHQNIRVSTGVILFVSFIVLSILNNNFILGYLFRRGNTSDLSLGFEILRYGLILFLFIIANHLMSTLQNGEGFFRDIFIGTMISFAPIILFQLPLCFVTNFLTYNESFIYTIGMAVLYGWSILNLLIMIKFVHNYTVPELIVNILLTLFTMIILVFIYLIVYILFMQMFDFANGIIKEVVLRNA